MDNKTKTEIRAIIADAVAEKISQSDATEQIIGLSSPPPQGNPVVDSRDESEHEEILNKIREYLNSINKGE